jgi:hypothetical protein
VTNIRFSVVMMRRHRMNRLEERAEEPARFQRIDGRGKRPSGFTHFRETTPDSKVICRAWNGEMHTSNFNSDHENLEALQKRCNRPSEPRTLTSCNSVARGISQSNRVGCGLTIPMTGLYARRHNPLF